MVYLKSTKAGIMEMGGPDYYDCENCGEPVPSWEPYCRCGEDEGPFTEEEDAPMTEEDDYDYDEAYEEHLYKKDVMSWDKSDVMSEFVKIAEEKNLLCTKTAQDKPQISKMPEHKPQIMWPGPQNWNNRSHELVDSFKKEVYNVVNRYIPQSPKEDRNALDVLRDIVIRSMNPRSLGQLNNEISYLVEYVLDSQNLSDKSKEYLARSFTEWKQRTINVQKIMQKEYNDAFAKEFGRPTSNKPLTEQYWPGAQQADDGFTTASVKIAKPSPNPYQEDPDQIKEKRLKTPEKHIMEIAHPDPVYVAEARGDGALVENELEQQKKTIEMINKMPTGSLVGRYASAALELVKLADKCDEMGDVEAAAIITDAASNLLKHVSDGEETGFLPFVKAPIDL
jgi:hypothetical protein